MSSYVEGVIREEAQIAEMVTTANIPSNQADKRNQGNR